MDGSGDVTLDSTVGPARIVSQRIRARAELAELIALDGPANTQRYVELTLPVLIHLHQGGGDG